MSVSPLVQSFLDAQNETLRQQEAARIEADKWQRETNNPNTLANKHWDMLWDEYTKRYGDEQARKKLVDKLAETTAGIPARDEKGNIIGEVKPGISGGQPSSAPDQGDVGVPRVGPLGRTQPEPQLQQRATTGVDVEQTTLPGPSGPPVQADSINPAANFARTLFGMQGATGPTQPADTLGQPTPGQPTPLNRAMQGQADAGNMMIGQGQPSAVAPMAQLFQPPAPQKMVRQQLPSGNYGNVPVGQLPQQPTSMRQVVTKAMIDVGAFKPEDIGKYFDVPAGQAGDILKQQMKQAAEIVTEQQKPKASKEPSVERDTYNAAAIAAIHAYNENKSPAQQIKIDDPNTAFTELVTKNPELGNKIRSQIKQGDELPDVKIMRAMTAAIAQDKIEAINDRKRADVDRAHRLEEQPSLYFQITDKDDRARIELAAKKLGIPIPSKKLDTATETKMNAAQNVMASIKTVKRVEQQLNTLTQGQATGPVIGRWNSTEQTFGEPLLNKDPRIAGLQQQLYTQLNYLVGYEARAMFGGRIPVQILESFKNASANVNKYRPFFYGALTAMQENAANVVHIAHDGMFEKSSKMNSQSRMEKGAQKNRYWWKNKSDGTPDYIGDE